jgi:16S rRNA (cytosine967-C5)-methyltransferase
LNARAWVDAAAELLREVLKFQSPTDAVVANFFKSKRSLGPRERGALAATAFEVVRRKSQWVHLAQAGSGPMERRLALLAWQGPPGVPAEAASAEESVWLTHARTVDVAGLAEPLRHNMPMWLAQALKSEVPNNGFWPLVEALAQPASLDLRVNLLKAKRPEVQRELQALGIESYPTPYSPWGLRVVGKPQLQRLAPVTSGAVELQDEGSQLLAWLTGAARGELVIDFCAGAGGKTLALGAMMRNTGQLYAFDTAAHRLDALKPRLMRSGLTHVYASAIAHENDARLERWVGKADRVLVDAPCSGVGTLRRSPDLKWRQSEGALAELQRLQRSILASASRLVRSGGYLVYATCSLLRAENECVADAFDQEHARHFGRVSVADRLAAIQAAASHPLSSGMDLRLWPHLHGTDGFYAAVWHRR